MTDIIEKNMTSEEAIKFIRASRNRDIFLMASTAAPVIGKEDSYYSLGGCIRVNAPQMVKFIADIYRSSVVDKASVKISYNDRCLFVGGMV